MYKSVKNFNNQYFIENYKHNTNTNQIEIEKYNEHGPKVWGKPFWFSLHNGALHYPDNPDYEQIISQVGFIKGIPSILPCPICRNHAKEYILRFDDNFLYNVASSSEKLFEFYWKFHNEVNTIAQYRKPTITLEEAYDIYMNNPTKALI